MDIVKQVKTSENTLLFFEIQAFHICIAQLLILSQKLEECLGKI